MRAIITILIMSLLSGCGFSHHSGNSALTMNMVETAIVKGKTTKTDLVTSFGPPQTIQKKSVSAEMQANPNIPAMAKSPETWIYWSHSIDGSSVVLPFVAHTSTQSSMITLAVYLDENGTVIDYSTTQTIR